MDKHGYAGMMAGASIAAVGHPGTGHFQTSEQVVTAMGDLRGCRESKHSRSVVADADCAPILCGYAATPRPQTQALAARRMLTS